jgi:cyclase
VFIPITIGGGIRSLQDMEKALESGADKVAFNTGAVRNPKLIQEAAYRFGSQAIVASIEGKRHGSQWLAYMDNGREPTAKTVSEWAQELESLGAGELLITSVDKEGTKKGFDVELIKIVNQAVSIPVIACGGLGNADDIYRLLQEVKPSALAAASVLHYNTMNVAAIKTAVAATGEKVREAA